MNSEAKQLGALSFCAMSVPAVLLFPPSGWLCAGLAGAVSTGLVWLFQRKPCNETAFTRASQGLPGKALVTASFLWNCLAMGAASRALCGIFPTAQPTPLIGLILLLLAAYAAQNGRLLPVAAICFFFLLGLYGLLFGFALPDLRVQWLAPTLAPDWAALSAVLLPMNALWLSGEKPARLWPWLAGGTALAVLASIITAGSLSPQITRELSFPFYEAAKSVSVLGVIQRLEPLLSAGLCAGGFCLLGLLCQVNGKMSKALRPQKKSHAGAVNFLLGTGGYYLSGLLPGWVFAIGSAIFWGFLPFLLQYLGFEKNFKKIRKKC